MYCSLDKNLLTTLFRVLPGADLQLAVHCLVTSKNLYLLAKLQHPDSVATFPDETT
jgi:hypothetical protein